MISRVFSFSSTHRQKTSVYRKVRNYSHGMQYLEAGLINNHWRVHMKEYSSHHYRSQILFGLLFIAVGITLFLDRFDILHVGPVWRYWPFLLVLFGINKMVPFSHTRKIMKGVWLVFLGFWLYVSIEHVWGLEFRDTWPMLIIAWGVSLAVRSFLKGQENYCVKEF